MLKATQHWVVARRVGGRSGLIPNIRGAFNPKCESSSVVLAHRFTPGIL
jgi:hypothetical protein